MTVFEALPILGSIQSLMALAYLVVHRRASFARSVVEICLFTALTLSVFDFPGAVGILGMPMEFGHAVSLAWAFIPPLAVMFGRDVIGMPCGSRRFLFMLLLPPSLVLGLMEMMVEPSCLIRSPCISLPHLTALWGMLAALIAMVALGRSLVACHGRVMMRPMGLVRVTLAVLMTVLLFLHAVAEGAAMTGSETAAGTALAASVAMVLALTVAALLVFRLFPEPPEAEDTLIDADHINRFRRHLAQAVVFEEGGVGPLVRGTILTTILTVLALLAWSGITPVKESAVTYGSVVPSSSIRPIQHLEGGIVAEILVKEGQLVEQGEVLLRLDPAQAKGELEQLKAREAGLELKAERLRAFAEGRAPEFEPSPHDTLQAQDQGTIFDAQDKARTSATAVLERQIDQRKSDIELFQRQIASIRPQISLLGREVAIRDELFKKGLTSQVVYLNTMREYERLKGEENRLQGQLKTAREALAEADQRRNDLGSKLSQDAYNEMGGVTAEMAQLKEARAKLEDRVTRLDIVAPVRGLIQELAVTSPGTVIQQGGMVTKIVPVDDVLMVENQITPRDIGHMQPGQPVRIKVTSYDFARFGALDGTLTQISPSTFLDEKKNPYYKGLVSLSKAHLGDDANRNRVLPGMTVQVDVITGEKTILQYLLKPLYVAAAQAFRER